MVLLHRGHRSQLRLHNKLNQLTLSYPQNGNLLIMKIKIALILLFLSFTQSAFAQIFYSKTEALELAFGKASIENLSLFPDEAQSAHIEQLAKTKLESGLFTFYVGKEGDKILGYAAIESETVRTKPETIMIVLTPLGEVRGVHLLAFHEPAEYMPPARWFDSLIKRNLDNMDFNKGVDAVSGATLSTRSALNSVRKVQAFYDVMVKK